MFGLFKKDPVAKLQTQYEKLMKEAHSLSHTDRSASDKKMQEAEEVANEIDRLKKAQS